MFTPKGPLAGSFQNTPLSRRRALASETVILASHAFAFVFNWYKSYHYSIIVLVLGSFSTYSKHINHSGQDGLNIFFRAPLFRSGLEARSNKNSNTNPVSTKCRLQTGYKMQTENLYCFFVWYVITCHITTYRASRNRFSAIIFTIIRTIGGNSLPVSWSQTFLK